MRRDETFPQTLLEIDGTMGTLRPETGYRLINDRSGDWQVRDVSPPLLSWAERPWHTIQESVALIQQDFVDCLHEGRVPETFGRANLRALALVEAAYGSARDGSRVRP